MAPKMIWASGPCREVRTVLWKINNIYMSVIQGCSPRMCVKKFAPRLCVKKVNEKRSLKSRAQLCAALCCSMLQCVAVLCIVLQCTAVFCNVLHCVAV